MMRQAAMFVFLFLVVTSLGGVGVARADTIYQYVFGAGMYQVPVNSIFDVPVFLQETISGSDTSVLAPGGAGLSGAGVRVMFNDTPQPSDRASVLSVNDIAASSAFDVVVPSVSSTDAGLSLFSLSNPIVHGEEYSPGVYRVLLGTFRFTAGSVLGETTRIRATDFDPELQDVITSDFSTLDGSIADGRSAITTVPEPDAISLLVAGGAMGLVYALRRRQVATAG